jgi:hypothetical protein
MDTGIHFNDLRVGDRITLSTDMGDTTHTVAAIGGGIMLEPQPRGTFGGYTPGMIEDEAVCVERREPSDKPASVTPTLETFRAQDTVGFPSASTATNGSQEWE